MLNYSYVKIWEIFESGNPLWIFIMNDDDNDDKVSPHEKIMIFCARPHHWITQWCLVFFF